MIERYQLRYFLAVAETGAFSRAARQVNVTQPTLSVGIAKLERRLGAPLFIRNSKRVHLTEAGARLLIHARAIEREFNAFETFNRPEPKACTLRLGVLSSIPFRLIEKFVQANCADPRPDVLELVEGAEADLLSRLERRRIDAALTILRAPRRGFRAERLADEGFRLAVWAGHPLAKLEVVAPEDLAGEVMLVRRHCELLQETSRFFTERGVRPRFSFRTYNDERAAVMVRAGLGVTVGPESWRARGITLVRLAGFEHRRELGLLFAEEAPDPTHEGSVCLRTIRQLFDDPDWRDFDAETRRAGLPGH